MVPPLKAGCLFCPTQSVYSSDGVLEEALSLAVMNPPVRAQAAVVIALWPTHTHIYNSKTMFIFLLETLKGVPRKLFPCVCVWSRWEVWSLLSDRQMTGLPSLPASRSRFIHHCFRTIVSGPTGVRRRDAAGKGQWLSFRGVSEGY